MSDRRPARSPASDARARAGRDPEAAVSRGGAPREIERSSRVPTLCITAGRGWNGHGRCTVVREIAKTRASHRCRHPPSASRPPPAVSRAASAPEGEVDTLIVIPNDVAHRSNEKKSRSRLKDADEVLLGRQGHRMITTQASSTRFADVKMIWHAGSGSWASGTGRAAAVRSPAARNATQPAARGLIEGARGICSPRRRQYHLSSPRGADGHPGAAHPDAKYLRSIIDDGG